MCFQVYLGSYSKCPERPYVAPSRYPEVALYAVKLLDNSEWPPRLTTPYRYHVGIMSCGCGFARHLPPLDEWELNNQRQLGEYVATCLRASGPIELFSVWNGDENAPIEKHRQIALEDLLDPEFYFDERQLTVVYRDKETLKAATS